MKQPPLNILFLVRDLRHGGAEYQLSMLAQGLHQRGHRVGVAVFYPGGSLEAPLRTAGVQIYSLDKRGRWDLLGFLWRLWRCLQQSEARCLHSYLPVANLLSLVVGGWRRDVRVIWGVRSSTIDAIHLGPTARLCQWLEQRLARFTDLTICNSIVGAQDAIARGFPAVRMRVVSNGIDTDAFRPDTPAGAHQRMCWGIPPDVALIGLVGRLDPLKAHPLFLQLAAQLRLRHPELHFVCIGGGPRDYQQHLQRLASNLGLENALHWVDHCETMPAAYNALTMLVSSSVSEGFANVIAEAMACAVPCVVTPVGDAQPIVADAGIVVASTGLQDLLGGCEQLLKLIPPERQQLGQRARHHIVTQFSVSQLIQHTEQLLGSLDRQQPLPAPRPTSTRHP